MQKLHSLHRVHRVSALNLNTAKKIANENKFDKDFIPIIDIDYSLVGKKSEYAYNGFIILDSNEVTQLSNYLDPNKNKQNLKIIKLFKDDVFIPFKI